MTTNLLIEIYYRVNLDAVSGAKIQDYNCFIATLIVSLSQNSEVGSTR